MLDQAPSPAPSQAEIIQMMVECYHLPVLSRPNILFVAMFLAKAQQELIYLKQFGGGTGPPHGGSVCQRGPMSPKIL